MLETERKGKQHENKRMIPAQPNGLIHSASAATGGERHRTQERRAKRAGKF
jgi:hypothetical protein